MQAKVYKILLIVLLGCCWTVFPVYAQQPPKILILPFSFHAEKDMSWLRNAIVEMLQSRLSVGNELVPVTVEFLSEPLSAPSDSWTELQVAGIGEQAGIDLIIFGGLTVFGESIGTDARLFQVSRKTTLVSFHRTGTQSGDLIQHINIFVQRIRSALDASGNGEPLP